MWSKNLTIHFFAFTFRFVSILVLSTHKIQRTLIFFLSHWIYFYLFIVSLCMCADTFDLIYLWNRFTHVDNFSTINKILNGKRFPKEMISINYNHPIGPHLFLPIFETPFLNSRNEMKEVNLPVHLVPVYCFFFFNPLCLFIFKSNSFFMCMLFKDASPFVVHIIALIIKHSSGYGWRLYVKSSYAYTYFKYYMYVQCTFRWMFQSFKTKSKKKTLLMLSLPFVLPPRHTKWRSLNGYLCNYPKMSSCNCCVTFI